MVQPDAGGDPKPGLGDDTSGFVRPDAILAVGITGHRHLAPGTDVSAAVEAALNEVFGVIRSTMDAIRRRDAPFFSEAPPTLRAVSMMAEGVDHLAMEVARRHGAVLAAVLPFSADDVAASLHPPASRAAFRTLLGRAEAVTVLPGEPGAPQAYARANRAILDQADLLVAVWDGLPARGWGGTAEVVQSALDRGLPVIVLTPTRDCVPEWIGEADDLLLPNRAADLPRIAFTDRAPKVIDAILAPPRHDDERKALTRFFLERDFTREAPRLEYQLLMRLASRPKVESSPVEGDGRAALPPSPIGGASDRAAKLDALHGLAEILAGRYGNLARSSALSRFFLLPTAALATGAASLIDPSYATMSIALQLVVNLIVFVDDLWRSRSHWRERWLDYRYLAEQLRCSRFLLPLGLPLPRDEPTARSVETAWPAWYAGRLLQSLRPDRTVFTAAAVDEATRFLGEVEIGGQEAYQRGTFFRFSGLEARLASASNVGLGVVTAASALLLVSHPSTWTPVLRLGVIVLPAFVTAASGIIAEAELIRFILRAAVTATDLAALRTRLSREPASFDRLVTAAEKAAVIMLRDLSNGRRRPARC